MPTPAELLEWRDALVHTRMTGTRVVQAGNNRVEYRTDAELAAAIADADRMLMAPSRGTPPTTIRFHTSKGV